MDEQEEERRWLLEAKQYLGEISALCFLPLPSHLSSLPYLLAGTGSHILLYDLKYGKIIESFQVFQGIRVHGIITCSSDELTFQIALFGEKRVKLFNLCVEPASVSLALLHSLPRLTHWVLDVSFLKVEDGCVAIGCSDNSVRVWNVARRSFILEVQSPDRCLLYSMRMWGDNIEALRIASGTIFNEIIVWKVVPRDDAQQLTNSLQYNSSLSDALCNSSQLQQHSAAHISRLIGHEGSIFRLAWSSDGRKLVSVSDDRSARIWVIGEEQKDAINHEMIAVGPVLFGHNARVWDCCIFNSLIVTAGEDCTCRVWDLCGKQLMMIKEHIGRGVWRCLYDPNTSVIVTAGFDSAIKLHRLPASMPYNSEGLIELKPVMNEIEIFTTQIPNSSHHSGLMDSKSEYVRCLHLTCEDTLYVATNNGYLYHTKILDTHDVNWTKLFQISEEVPIICMDLLSENSPKHSFGIDDCIALGDGKGNMTIVRVKGDSNTPEVDFTVTWSTGKERQLLGTYWCKALGPRFVFSTDPRGILKLWKLHDPQQSVSRSASRTSDVLLIAEFESCFGIRIICLDVSFEDEVLVCGDLRGNLILFPLLRSLLQETPVESEVKVPPLTYFRGAHGISSVSSVTIAKFSLSWIEICSTGGDGCVCYFEYDKGPKNFEFVGMKHVKELSLLQNVCSEKESTEDLANCGYAVGFASTEFIIWNFKTEAKIVQIPCGGWRRPNSYYLGDVPELKNCFAYVKDEIIYFHRQWVPNSWCKIFPRNLHVQFHGREVHSLCFIAGSTVAEANGKLSLSNNASWIASGCEDGTVRLTRFTPREKSLFSSKLLGEHVGGSAVRSICCVSKVHMIDWRDGQRDHTKDKDNPFLLISVGAKRVLTSWLMRDTSLEQKEKTQVNQEHHNEYDPSISGCSSMSFKWLSSDMPAKNSSACGRKKDIKSGSLTENLSSEENDAISETPEMEKTELKTSLLDKSDDDWRFMAVTAFLVRCIGSRLTICFVIVASSDATLALRALVLPHRLWFDVALLDPLSSPVLALQHVIIPMHLPSEGNYKNSNVYVVISGATDGSVALWDLTDTVEAFVHHLSSNDAEKFSSHQTRPRIGRGSQGGRWWKSLSGGTSKKRSAGSSAASRVGEKSECTLVNDASIETLECNGKSCKTVSPKDKSNASLVLGVHTVYDSFPEMREIRASLVLNNVHQSGVNSLHVSGIEDCQSSHDIFQFSLISGGDDQALHYLRFEISPSSMVLKSKIVKPLDMNLATKSTSTQNFIECCQIPKRHYRIRCVHHNKISSAHSSAIKAVWTDGTWVFSTGLDQRIRCWFIEDNCKLREQTHLIISVPEPEAMHARAYGRNKYEIAVAGRGMQIVEFSAF